MSRYNYWQECIECAFGDAGITATAEQMKEVAYVCEGAHENYGQATGHDVFSQNLSSSKDGEIERLKKELRNEREKSVCPTCVGKKYLTTTWGSSGRSSTSQCDTCRGEGRI